MKIDPKLQGITIVLIGDFNPRIFQPFWFDSQNIIRAEEAENAKINIIHPDITDFNLDWLNVQVSRERFVASTQKEPYYPFLYDLVLSTFRLLEHTPIRMLGINREMHFQLRSLDQWHGFGHQLAPKEIWKDLLESPGVKSITMQGDVDRKGYSGYVRVTVEPSIKVDPNGVYFKINDHYDIKKDKRNIGCSEIVSILEKEYDNSISRSDKIIYSLLEKGVK